MHKNLYTWLFFLNFDSSNNIENYLHSNEMTNANYKKQVIKIVDFLFTDGSPDSLLSSYNQYRNNLSNVLSTVLEKKKKKEGSISTSNHRNDSLGNWGPIRGVERAQWARRISNRVDRLAGNLWYLARSALACNKIASLRVDQEDRA